MKNVVIVLTGTVTPNVDFVERNSVEDRLNDYEKCIDFYLSNTSHTIVFAENSGFDPSRSEKMFGFLKNDRFRWESITPHPDFSKGKGFQEFYTLDQLADKGLLGEYLVRNVESLIRKMKVPFHIDNHQKMKVSITGFFGISTKFYREFFYGLYTEVNDSHGRFIEHAVYDTIHSKNLYQYQQLLPENPQYEGVSGSHGNSMKRNPYKMKVRAVERRLNRILGIRKFLIEY